MTTVEKFIIVNVPLQTAYDQWTHFEEFPQFMEGVKKVTPLDDRRLHWKVEIAGLEKEWEFEVIECVAEERIVWAGPRGSLFGGVVTFQSISASKTKILMQRWGILQKNRLNLSRDGIDPMGVQLQKDLERFKEFVEIRVARETQNPVDVPNGQRSFLMHRNEV